MKRIPKPATTQIILLGLIIFLSLAGLLFVFEASTAESFALFDTPYHFLVQHSIGLAIGTVGLIVGYSMPPRLWFKIAPYAFIIGCLALLATLIPGIGVELNGARRWLSVGGFRFQTVEFVKFALVLYYADWMSRHQKFGPFLFLTAIPILFVMLQPDLGSTLLIGGIAVSMYFLAGGELKKLAVLGSIALPLVLAAIITSPYRLRRLTTFINPDSDPLGASFHIRQITLALGRGGWFGQGLGNSNQKYSYIPEASTDSIFAIIAEEVGFIGSLFFLATLFAYFIVAYKIVRSQDKNSSSLQLLGSGILAWLAIQALLNLSAVVGLIPLTGMPLPFFSYGRSSQVMVLFASGILLRLAKKEA